MKKRLILIFISCSFLLAQTGEHREMLFKKGVSCYAAKKYRQAIELFSEIEKSGQVSYELFYNLGNTYYKMGNIGQAIRYWEKALKINPSNKDVIYNLNIARERIKDQIVLPDMFFLFKFYMDLRQSASTRILINISGIILCMTVLVFIMRRWSKLKTGKKKYSATAVILIICFIFSSALTIDTAYFRKRNNYGIVLIKTLEIRNEPTQESTAAFILHEGAKVRIDDIIEDTWLKISYFDDKTGWAPSGTIGDI